MSWNARHHFSEYRKSLNDHHKYRREDTRDYNNKKDHEEYPRFPREPKDQWELRHLDPREQRHPDPREFREYRPREQKPALLPDPQVLPPTSKLVTSHHEGHYLAGKIVNDDVNKGKNRYYIAVDFPTPRRPTSSNQSTSTTSLNTVHQATTSTSTTGLNTTAEPESTPRNIKGKCDLSITKPSPFNPPYARQCHDKRQISISNKDLKEGASILDSIMSSTKNLHDPQAIQDTLDRTKSFLKDQKDKSHEPTTRHVLFNLKPASSIPPKKPVKRKYCPSNPALTSDIPKYSCDACQNDYTTTYSLRRHIDSAHRPSKKFYCEECGHDFTRRYSVATHYKNSHPNIPVPTSVAMRTTSNDDSSNLSLLPMTRKRTNPKPVSTPRRRKYPKTPSRISTSTSSSDSETIIKLDDSKTTSTITTIRSSASSSSCSSSSSSSSSTNSNSSSSSTIILGKLTPTDRPSSPNYKTTTELLEELRAEADQETLHRMITEFRKNKN